MTWQLSSCPSTARSHTENKPVYQSSWSLHIYLMVWKIWGLNFSNSLRSETNPSHKPSWIVSCWFLTRTVGGSTKKFCVENTELLRLYWSSWLGFHGFQTMWSHYLCVPLRLHSESGSEPSSSVRRSMPTRVGSSAGVFLIAYSPKLHKKTQSKAMVLEYFISQRELSTKA